MIGDLFAILGLAVGTWGIRAAFIVTAQGREIAVALDRWLTFARPAVLAGLLASLTMRGAAPDELGLLVYAAAVGAALVTAVWTHRLTLALLAGVVALFVLAQV